MTGKHLGTVTLHVSLATRKVVTGPPEDQRSVKVDSVNEFQMTRQKSMSKFISILRS